MSVIYLQSQKVILNTNEITMAKGNNDMLAIYFKGNEEPIWMKCKDEEEVEYTIKYILQTMINHQKK